MVRKSTKEQRARKFFLVGLLFLAIAFWMIFISKDNLGFIPGFLGALLVLWKH